MRESHVSRCEKTYLTADGIELGMTDIDYLCEGTNPDIVIFRVVESHDGLYARPGVIVGMYAKAAI
jgi:hypothetical protein